MKKIELTDAEVAEVRKAITNHAARLDTDAKWDKKVQGYVPEENITRIRSAESAKSKIEKA